MSDTSLYKILFDEIQYLKCDDFTNQEMDEMASALLETLKRNVLVLKDFVEEFE